MTEPTMKTAPGHGVKIQLAQWGDEGKPILCIHGITANCRCWDVMASNLSPDHRVMAMDLRGRGRSESPDSGYSIKHHLQRYPGDPGRYGTRKSGDYGALPGRVYRHGLRRSASGAGAPHHPGGWGREIIANSDDEGF